MQDMFSHHSRTKQQMRGKVLYRVMVLIFEFHLLA